MSAAGDVRYLLRDLREVRAELERTRDCLRKLDEATRKRGQCPLCDGDPKQSWHGHADGCEIVAQLDNHPQPRGAS